MFGLSNALPQKPPSAPKGGGVINGQALSLPKPEYSAAARAAKASGSVSVQVTIDENGNVFSAEAISGHSLLRDAAEQAAWQAKFSPTKLQGKAVRVTGVIVYNFVLPTASSSNAEKIKMLGLGMILYTLREIGAELDLESSAIESINVFENLNSQLEPLGKLQNSSKEQKKEIVGSVVLAVENSIGGSDIWQFETGKQLANLAVQMQEYKESNFKNKINSTKLQNTLLKIKELILSAPSDMPADILEKIKSMSELADKADLSADEKMGVIAVKMLQLFQLIEP